MAKKIILLIEDNAKTEAAIREALGKGYSVETAKDEKAAAAYLEKKTPDLILIDFDLRKKDGLQVFKELQPGPKVIMLSASGSIPLAVSATKLGVAEFLRKPLNAEQLKSAVEQNIAPEEVKLSWVEGLEWLRGGSPHLIKMFGDIQQAVQGAKDILLVGERGIPKDKIAEFINANSAHKNRRLVKLDMSSFRREALEPHFWASVQEFMTLPQGSSLPTQKERCGTLYLENVGNLDEHFMLALFNFFKVRNGKMDKSVRAVFSFYSRSSLPKLVKNNAGAVKDYFLIEVPPLRQRKEDLPYLLEFYLKRASRRYNKNVEFVSTELLEFLAGYDYPGNYLELEKMIEEAVLKAAGKNLELKDFPVDFKGILSNSLKQGISESLTLEEAKRGFEKDLYHLLLKKSEGASLQVSRFLDVPKSVLGERLKDLVD